jgi:xanthine dehydrogenase YagR molybdenum-binding subunit
MAEEQKPVYSWPPMEKRKVMGKRISRLDGVAKSSGRAKYSSDIKRPGMLYAALLTSPHAHARITHISTAAAEKTSGVAAVQVIAPAGTVVQWAGAEIAAVAAISEEIARDAVRKIQVQYEVLPHVVQEQDLKKVSSRAKPAGEVVSGDPDKAFKEADVVSSGVYGIPVITHCCLEPHGQVIEWKGEKIEYWPTTQNISGIGGDLARSLEVPANTIHAQMEHMGGGFGSKFPSDTWGRDAALLSKKSGGRAVKLFLDRETELTIAGNRPSIFAEIKLAARKDGTLTAWESRTWSTGGLGGGGLSAELLPYVYRNVPNRRINHTAVTVNAGSARAWRAPNHPQVSFLTCSALEDMAAQLKMDPMEFLARNANYTQRPEVYRKQLQIAADMIGWKKLWHPRGDSGPGPIKRGLGIGVATWGGSGHDSQCRTIIHPDGSVEIESVRRISASVPAPSSTRWPPKASASR